MFSMVLPFFLPPSYGYIIVESLENTRGGDIGDKLGKDLAEFVENLLGYFFGSGGRRIEPGNL